LSKVYHTDVVFGEEQFALQLGFPLGERHCISLLPKTTLPFPLIHCFRLQNTMLLGNNKCKAYATRPCMGTAQWARKLSRKPV